MTRRGPSPRRGRGAPHRVAVERDRRISVLRGTDGKTLGTRVARGFGGNFTGVVVMSSHAPTP